MVPTLALSRSGSWVVELGSTSQPGQIPSSPLSMDYSVYEMWRKGRAYI